MVLLNQQKLSKEDLACIAHNTHHLISLFREGRLQKSCNTEALKTITPLAINGQIEALEKYCQLLSPTAKFNSEVFRHINSLINKPNKDARVLMVLASYFEWKAKEKTATAPQKQVIIENLPETKQAAKFRMQAVNMLKKTAQLDPLAQGYLYNTADVNLQVNVKDASFLMKMRNFRGKLQVLISKQVNEENKFKFLSVLVENVIRFGSMAEYSKSLNQVTKLFNDAQKPPFSTREGLAYGRYIT